MRHWLAEKQKVFGYKNVDVARLCDIHKSYYTNILKGDRNPSVPVAKRIGKVLGFDWRLFFEDDVGGTHTSTKEVK